MMIDSRQLVLVFLLGVIPVAVYAQAKQDVTLYVSPAGNDAWSGRLADPTAEGNDGPLKTLAAARDKIRRLESGDSETGAVCVYLRGGAYMMDEAFELGPQDGGTEKTPVLYSTYQGETVRLVGGREIRGFVPVTDPNVLGRLDTNARAHILQINLTAQGVTDFGELTGRGFGRPIRPAALELFFQDRRMTLARWPNTGWVTIAGVPNGQDGGQFTYSEDAPGKWAKSDDIWVHGFWTQDWADSYEHVKSIDPATKTVETHPPHGVYGYTKNHRFYFLNILEALDSPGEWYLDRSSGILYFWPPDELQDAAPIVSMTKTALFLNGCSYVTFRGLTIECTRGTAIRIQGGHDNRIADCTIRHIGNTAAAISGGRNNGIAGCTIYDAGDGGISLSGGDTKTLTPAGLYADNNHIYNYNCWCLTYRPAVGIHGVGNRISHNRIHDGPHNAIQLGGNDHRIAYNDISNVCTESDDVGAFYTGRSWTNRGTVIEYNYFHHIHSAEDQYRHGSRVVYLDDAASGFTIRGNVFYKAGSLCAINVGGGRDNRIENNIFIDCAKGVVIDTRGVGWASGYIAEGGDWHMYEKLKAAHFDEPPYSTRYPELAVILDNAPAEPRGNMLIRNLAVRTPLLDMPGAYRHLLTEKDNWSTDANPGFVNADQQDFRLKSDSPVFDHIPGFEPIGFEKIGPQQTASRSSESASGHFDPKK